jgi:hypothetical protein
VTDADQRPTAKDSAAGEASGRQAAPSERETEVVEENPYAAPPENVAAPAAPWGTAPDGTPAGPPPEPGPWGTAPDGTPPAPPTQPAPWGAPPQQPYGQVQPGSPQPWGAHRPSEPEQPNSGWGDPHRYGEIQPPDKRDPDRQYRDQRESRSPDKSPRRERDLPTRWALGLSLGATICTMLALYQGPATFPAWMVGAAAGLAFAVAAFVMAIRAQRLAADTGRRAPEATASLVSACVSGTLALLLLVTSIVWFGPLRDYAKCMSGANTQSGQDACVTQLEHSTGMSTK